MSYPLKIAALTAVAAALTTIAVLLIALFLTLWLARSCYISLTNGHDCIMTNSILKNSFD